MRLRRAIQIAVVLSVATFAGGFWATQLFLRMSGVRVNVVALDYELRPAPLSASELAEFDLSSELPNAPLRLALQQDRRLHAQVDTSNLVYFGAAPTSDTAIESVESFVQYRQVSLKVLGDFNLPVRLLSAWRTQAAPFQLFPERALQSDSIHPVAMMATSCLA